MADCSGWPWPKPSHFVDTRAADAFRRLSVVGKLMQITKKERTVQSFIQQRYLFCKSHLIGSYRSTEPLQFESHWLGVRCNGTRPESVDKLHNNADTCSCLHNRDGEKTRSKVQGLRKAPNILKRLRCSAEVPASVGGLFLLTLRFYYF